MARQAHKVAAPVIPDLAVPEAAREFAFSDADFRNLVQLAREHAGIALSDSKRNLVYTRVSRRLRALGFTAFRQYRDYLAKNSGELESFINAISTNLTKFFRESHHFDHFRSHVVQPFLNGSLRSDGRLRVWSAGCSTGEEPYTIAAVLRHEMPSTSRHDIRILATDIDTDVLAKGARGVYPVSGFDNVPRIYRDYFEPTGERDDSLMAKESIRSLIAFRRLNLMDPWPFRGKFDAIFCRNVMIYFDNPTKTALIDRFIQSIKPGGFLYIGHSESFHGTHAELQLVGRTTYRRKA
ncbi:protein-glutamate O-methyltransferase CheR [Pseudorhodoplanes sp.]|uniref:CheR family methyltransferase n=1 Tax=Pseudorhodoplanes sp. TaxID=1934341 RepID=UPI002BEBB90A|nr:protein-glutamate O-methyltransferase CheR [Pseudorhodoplanes sp.]HWV52961.1 protein-glutamate O-methyltransferase CheR [Pseudorhodoplanes sp.]